MLHGIAIGETVACVDREVHSFAPQATVTAMPHIKTVFSFVDNFRVSVSSTVPEKFHGWLLAEFIAQSLDFVLVLKPQSLILHNSHGFEATAATAFFENGLHLLPRR